MFLVVFSPKGVKAWDIKDIGKLVSGGPGAKERAAGHRRGLPRQHVRADVHPARHLRLQRRLQGLPRKRPHRNFNPCLIGAGWYEGWCSWQCVFEKTFISVKFPDINVLSSAHFIIYALKEDMKLLNY